MKKAVFAAVAAAVLAGSAATYTAVAAPDAPWRHMVDRGFMLDAKLAGMKTALKLTPDQEKLWPAFETAVRDGVKMRQDSMREMREEMHGADRPSPIAMMTEMSDRLAKGSEALKHVADSAKPLYESLDADQKAHFGPLLHMLREHGGHHGSWGGEHGPKPL